VGVGLVRFAGAGAAGGVEHFLLEGFEGGEEAGAVGDRAA
jgi:hypothetical protein